MRQQMCDFDKSAGTLFFPVARSLPAYTTQYVCACIHVYTRNSLEITWRDEKIHTRFWSESANKKIHVEGSRHWWGNINIDTNNQDMDLIN